MTGRCAAASRTARVAAVALVLGALGACRLPPRGAEQRFAVVDSQGGVVGGASRECDGGPDEPRCVEWLTVSVEVDGTLRTQRVALELDRAAPQPRWRLATADVSVADPLSAVPWAMLHATRVQTPLEAALRALDDTPVWRRVSVLDARAARVRPTRVLCARGGGERACVLLTRPPAVAHAGPDSTTLSLERGLALRALASAAAPPAVERQAAARLWRTLAPATASEVGDPAFRAHRAGFVVRNGPARWPAVARQRVATIDPSTVRVDVLREPSSRTATELARAIRAALPPIGPNAGRVGGDLADCTEVAQLAQRLMADRGIAARVVIGVVPSMAGTGWVWHAWLVARIDGQETSLDPVSAQAPVPANWLTVGEPVALDGVELDALVGRLTLEVTAWAPPAPPVPTLQTEP